MQNVNTLCIAAQSPQGTHSTYGIVQRTQSDRTADGIRLDGGRNLIGRRTETGGDVPPTDTPTKQSGLPPKGVHLSQVHQPSKQGYIPTEYAEHTEPSGRESLPQIGTDAHRLGGYGIPAIPTLPITQPNHLWKSVKSVGEYYHAHKQADGESVPQNTQNTQNILAEKASHRFHRCAQIRRVWHSCHTHAANNAA